MTKNLCDTFMRSRLETNLWQSGSFANKGLLCVCVVCSPTFFLFFIALAIIFHMWLLLERCCHISHIFYGFCPGLRDVVSGENEKKNWNDGVSKPFQTKISTQDSKLFHFTYYNVYSSVPIMLNKKEMSKGGKVMD